MRKIRNDTKCLKKSIGRIKEFEAIKVYHDNTSKTDENKGELKSAKLLICEGELNHPERYALKPNRQDIFSQLQIGWIREDYQIISLVNEIRTSI